MKNEMEEGADAHVPVMTDGVASKKREREREGMWMKGGRKTTLVMLRSHPRVATTIFERVTSRTSGDAARGRVLGAIEKIRRRRRRTNGGAERLVEKIHETTRVNRSAAALSFLGSA